MSYYLERLSSALLYATASLSLTIVNKTVLTYYQFPSFLVLGLCQMLATMLILGVCRSLGVIEFQGLHMESFTQILPLPALHLGAMVTGLGSTKHLNLPMFSALRRFTIVITMIAERYMLNTKISSSVFYSVMAMVIGAMIAVYDDVTFSLYGYSLIFSCDVLTAMNMVVLKQKLNSKEINMYGIMFYNNLFVVLPMGLFVLINGDFDQIMDFEYWDDFWFVCNFITSAVMGCFLAYSITACTLYNGPLATTVIGCVKNISVTYLGFVIGGDYVFTLINCIGLHISMFGSLVYSYVTFVKKGQNKPSRRTSVV